MNNVLNYHKIPYTCIIKKYGRLYLKTTSAKKAAIKLSKVFGVSSLSPALETHSKLSDITAKSVFLAGITLQQGNSFGVRCRRVGDHSYTSIDVCRKAGSQILSELHGMNLRVDLEKPDVELGIEIREDRAFIYTTVVKGFGGLPLGTQPKVICLLSGGLDSPVACWLVMKRGCPIVPIYFDNTPFTGESTTKRALKTAKILFDWAIGFKRKIYVIPHGQNLTELEEKCPKRFTCILCKRIMYRIAERIADIEDAEGIVTGEAVGEQASQTLGNLRVLSGAVTKYPIHRPLLCFDKMETVQLAKKIGTYDVSTQRVKGCTAVPSNPTTLADLKKVEKAEKTLKMNEIVDRTLKSLKVMYI